jgi:predicted dinucleotide-binding enzyme
MNFKLITYLLLLAPLVAFGDTIAVIGTGNVGMALGTEFGGLGHTVIYGSREPDSAKALGLVNKTKNSSSALPSDAALQADVVILAVPGMVTEAVVNTLGDLSGKIIIDATNPLVFAGNPPKVSYGTDRSLGEIVQDAQPGAFVVKTFNTIGWEQMIDPPVPPPVIPIAGNNDVAKQKVAAWVQAMGIDTVDIGEIHYSLITEYMVVMFLNNQSSGGPKFDLVFSKPD